MNFLFLICTFLSSVTLEEKIKFLNPHVSPETTAIVVSVLKEQLPKLNLDENLVLAVISKESNFQRIYTAGASGEWGMLQVIPSDAHIQAAAKKYRCNELEMKGVIENGRVLKLCRCSPGGTKCNLPNIGYFANNTYKVDAVKLATFFKHSPRAALFVGLQELNYWRTKYLNTLRARYWNVFPAYLFSSKDRTLFRKWWEDTKTQLKSNIWVVHHNYGGTIKTSHTARWYPRMIYKQIQRLEALDGKKIRENTREIASIKGKNL